MDFFLNEEYIYEEDAINFKVNRGTNMLDEKLIREAIKKEFDKKGQTAFHVFVCNMIEKLCYLPDFRTFFTKEYKKAIADEPEVFNLYAETLKLTLFADDFDLNTTAVPFNVMVDKRELLIAGYYPKMIPIIKEAFLSLFSEEVVSYKKTLSIYIKDSITTNGAREAEMYIVGMEHKELRTIPTAEEIIKGGLQKSVVMALSNADVFLDYQHMCIPMCVVLLDTEGNYEFNYLQKVWET